MSDGSAEDAFRESVTLRLFLTSIERILEQEERTSAAKLKVIEDIVNIYNNQKLSHSQKQTEIRERLKSFITGE